VTGVIEISIYENDIFFCGNNLIDGGGFLRSSVKKSSLAICTVEQGIVSGVDSLNCGSLGMHIHSNVLVWYDRSFWCGSPIIMTLQNNQWTSS